MPWSHIDLSSLHWVDSARFGSDCKRYNHESATERLREGNTWIPSTLLAVNPSVSTMNNGAMADSVGDSGQQTPEESRGSRETSVFGRFKKWLKHCCSLSKKDHALTADDLKVMEGTYWLTRIVFFRTLGFVYFTAFLIAHIQGPGLFGQDGLFRLEDTPPCTSSSQDSRELWTRFAAEPSLFHFFNCTDASLLFITASGLVLSAVLILTGGVTVPVLLWLWLSYMTIQAAGQRFYTFTWDTLLLEVGFWAMPLTLICFLPSFLPLTSAPSPSNTTPGRPSARPSILKSATMSHSSAAGGGFVGAEIDPRHLKEAGDGRGSTSATAELSSTDGVHENPSGPESDSSSSKKRSTLRGQQMLRWPRAALQLLLRCCHSLVSPGAPFLPPTWPTPWISVWGYRWLLFRLMLGAGLIKLRADTAWTNLTAMQWHYETQPLPNPVAWFAHRLPMSMHKFEVLMNHFAELVLPFAVLSPWRQLRLFTGCCQLLFQVAIIITGNLAFINWLTIVFTVFLFDDRFLMWLFPTSTLNKLRPLLQGCPGSWSFPSSDSVTKDTNTSVSKSESEKSPREPPASSEQRPLLRNEVKLRETSEAEEAHCPPSSSSTTTAAVSRALPWRLLTGPKWTGRALRRMLATWGCWRIPLFLFTSAVLVTSDGVILLLLGKAATAPSLSTTLVWESAGLLLTLTSVVALGGLAGAAGVPWSLLGAAVSAFSPRFTAENQHPLTDLASVEQSETRENASLPTSPEDSEWRGTVLRRPRQTEEDVGGQEGGVVASRRQSDSVVDANEGRDEAKLLWKRTQDVGALAFEVLVAGVVLANLLFMHFHLGPTFAGLDLLTGLLCVLLLAFAHRHCSNAFLVLRVMTEVGLLIVLVWRSIPVVENLLSPHQIMNDTYDSFRLVNSYGLFGFMTKQREELVIQGTYEPDPPSAPANPAWQTYEFYCKPGDIDRRPCFVSPYYYRLDWLMWFAAFNADVQAPYWLLRLVKKMLANDPKTSALLAHNPFRGKRPPRFIRILRYDYHFAYKGKEQDMYEQGKWWQRKYLSEFLPPVSAALFRKI